MTLREQIAKIIATHITGDSADWTEWEAADAILDLKVEYFDNSIATGPRYWTKTLRELERE